MADKYSKKVGGARSSWTADQYNYPNNTNVDPTTNRHGHLYVDVVRPPSPTSGLGNYRQFWANVVHIDEPFSAGEPFLLTAVNGFNPSASAPLYLHLFDQLPDPLLTAIQQFLIPPNGSFSWVPVHPGIWSELYIVPSSTPGVYTPIVGAPNFWAFLEIDEYTP